MNNEIVAAKSEIPAFGKSALIYIKRRVFDKCRLFFITESFLSSVKNGIANLLYKTIYEELEDAVCPV